MSQESFTKSIYNVAENLKGFRLTDYEKAEITKRFNSSKKSTSAEKAREAIESVIGGKLPERFLIIEKSLSGTLDNLDRLILQMHAEADNWDKKS